MEDTNDNEYHGKTNHIIPLDQNHEERKNLNFNAPLLTTRRPANLASISLTSCPSIVCRRTRTSNNEDHHYRVPFSWEKAPGKPKDNTKGRGGGDEDNDVTPRLKLPPSLWRYRHMIAATITNNDDEDIEICDADFPLDANVDEACRDHEDDFSDAVDVFSLSEAIDIVERARKSHEMDGLRLKIMEDRLSRSEEQYPDFIIQRFLPDATALATASALRAMSLKKNSFTDQGYDCNDYYLEAQKSTTTSTTTTKMSFSSPKGCGFKMFFPNWSVRHKLCGVKNPVRRVGTDVFSGCTRVKLSRRRKEKRR